MSASALCLTETTSGGGLLRGRTVLDAAWILNGYTLTERQTEDLMTLGCLTELFNAAYCVWDDIMDGSATRRNKPCWYRREGVGLTAINDGCLIRSAIYVVLKERFRDHPAYQDFVELFSETALRTEMGQLLDTMASTHALKVNQFTWDHYEYIVENKTSNYTYYVPMALPILYLGIASSKRLSEVYKAAMTLGLIFQARDDFLDVYGDFRITGKIGTDIQENKCNWLSVTALKYSNDEQRKLLETCYGTEKNSDIVKVKALFDQLDLAEKFRCCDQRVMGEAHDLFRVPPGSTKRCTSPRYDTTRTWSINPSFMEGSNTIRWLFDYTSLTWNESKVSAYATSDTIQKVIQLGLESSVQRIAASITKGLRDRSNETAIGSVLVNESYVYVSWSWIWPPVIVLALTVLFLILTVSASRNDGSLGLEGNLWKNSTLPVLYHGLDEMEIHDQNEDSSGDHDRNGTPEEVQYMTLSQMEKAAESATVQLELSPQTGRLMLR
ncbi:unnamed protein product [Penicillium pancosmium]